MEKLGAIYTSRNEPKPWRAMSYRKVAGLVRNHPFPIQTYKEALAIKGIGDKHAFKVRVPGISAALPLACAHACSVYLPQVMEIVRTGTTTRLKLEEGDPKTIASQKFMGV